MQTKHLPFFNNLRQIILSESYNFSHSEESEQLRKLNQIINELNSKADTKLDKFYAERAKILESNINYYLLYNAKSTSASHFRLICDDINLIYKSLKKSGYKESFKLLIEYNNTGKEKFYYEAIEKGLFKDIYQIATKLSSINVCKSNIAISAKIFLKNENIDSKLNFINSEFPSLVENALRPINKYINDAMNVSDENITEKSKNILSRIAQSLVKVQPSGRPKKLPSADTPFGKSFKQFILILYRMLREAFKDVKKYKNSSEKKNHFNPNLKQDSFVNLEKDKLFRLEPYKAAKKVICSFFKISESSLEKILSKNSNSNNP
jgi:hypothetical protein